MTLKTNWGNDVLNAYAEQINDLEAQGSRTGAPAKYGKDLENWFNQLVKETRDSSGGKSTSGSSSAAGDGGTTEGGGKAGSGKAGSGGGPAGSGATPGSSGGSGPTPSVDSSIQQISNIAGPGAAQTVSGLAGQGAALSGGIGSVSGDAVAGAIADAGASGAQLAGATGTNPEAASVQAAQAAESAVQVVKNAGGSRAQQVAAAKAVEQAARFGGADAAQAASDALAAVTAKEGVAAGIAAAQAVADTAEAAKEAGFSTADVAKIAKAVGEQFKEGGSGAGQAASKAAQARLSANPGTTADNVSSDATLAGDSVQEAVKFMKNKGANSGRIATVTNDLVEASAFGADIAKTVSDAVINGAKVGGPRGGVEAAQADLWALKNIKQAGGTHLDMLITGENIAFCALAAPGGLNQQPRPSSTRLLPALTSTQLPARPRPCLMCSSVVATLV